MKNVRELFDFAQNMCRMDWMGLNLASAYILSYIRIFTWFVK